MAQVTLNLADVRRPEACPAVCVRCGRPAKGKRSIRLATTEPKRTSSWAWILWELGFWNKQQMDTFENLLHEYRISRGRLQLPVCWWHRWIVPPFIGAGVVNERKLELRGVSDEFVAAMRNRGRVR